MAIFERQPVNKVILDDTEPLTCVIENWRNVNGHTEFLLKVHRGPFSNQSWRIYKRYNDFFKLHTYLQNSGIPLELPPKRIIGNMDPEFINERQQGLQKYLNKILMNPILVSSLPARSFVDPANYCQPFGELALQQVSLALRGEVGWEVIGPLAEIGWRLRKHYYQIRSKSSKYELLGSWTDYGPDKYLDDKDMHAIFKSLNQIQHPFIHPIELCLCTDVGGLVIRQYHKNGTLRDIICNAKPKQSFMKKYGNPKGHKPLEINQIKLYGRQILEGLKFLHDKGLPYGHLHTGNVIIDDNDRVQLVDIENGILGVPSFYRPYFMQHRKINTIKAIDIYCFGHTLYEMVHGAPLHESVITSFDCPSIELKSILESILSAEALKSTNLITVDSLLNNNFFASVSLINVFKEKIHLKIPNSTKEHLKNVTRQIEERLKEEQKMVRSQKRFVKVQEMMSSEEEKKKQRHKLKQQLREQQSLNRGNSKNGDGETASSCGTSMGTATPPSAVPSPPPPPPPPLVTPPPPPPAPSSSNAERSALLGEICNFNKSQLRKAKATITSYS